MKTATIILFILDILAILSIILVMAEGVIFEKRIGSKYHHGSYFYKKKLEISIAISDALLYVVIVAIIYSVLYALGMAILTIIN